ncbi:sugar transferase [Neptunicoccus sediminis]|uniref:sugar transferase n=1 Tax=Neptunicoccus sediminis TaxID=1892596 RepID=UPI00084614BF|nr:sugar transferase [Neptunicoccus sediminis]
MTIEKFSTDFLHASPVVDRVPSSATLKFKIVKRLVDLGFSLALLPIFVLIACILFVLNPYLNRGRVMYSQRRVGRDGETFRIYKFRTMEGKNVESRFATEEQARIRRLGRFMRASRIDELPQILNVLLGQMSMVGPRPEQVKFYKQYTAAIPGYAARQQVRPGITGLAQLKYGYTSDEVGTARKLKWDLEYIRRSGFRLEFYIIVKTMVFVCQRLCNVDTKTKL